MELIEKNGFLSKPHEILQKALFHAKNKKNKEIPSIWCSLWYFLLPNILLSISTTLPRPPSFSRQIMKTSKKTLQQKEDQTAEAFKIFNCKEIKLNEMLLTQQLTNTSV